LEGLGFSQPLGPAEQASNAARQGAVTDDAHGHVESGGNLTVCIHVRQDEARHRLRPRLDVPQQARNVKFRMGREGIE
jgi:hypothetical protein